MSPVDADTFKDALASWASGVTVLTTEHEGQVYGITASSFSTLSMDPLLVLVCIQNGNHLERMVPASGKFAVSVLATGQDDVSNHFAVSGRALSQRALKAITLASPAARSIAPWVRTVGVQWLEKAYSQDQEYEADELGGRLMRAAGFDPAGSIRMLERLGALEPRGGAS
ncbi:MAG: flavin reductase, partial [Chloroflexi bacterium]|nr:flavin reductase [Chloroflexota bacterium]